MQSAVPVSLVGKPFDCVFGAFVPRLTYRSDNELRVQATIGEMEIDEVVDIGVTRLSPDVVLVSWTERNGNFVVQLQDHANAVVHNVARLADGQLFRGEGEIRPVLTV
ncbi:MAG: hypothetical protein AB7I79_02185 [Rhizobiaceae bacterium]